MDKLETRIEFIAIRMIGNQEATDIVDDPAQLFHLIDAADILIEPEGADMTPLSRHLDAAEEGDSTLPGVVFNLRIGPGIIVFSDAHAMQANLLRLVNQSKWIEITIRAATRRVSME